MTGVDFEPFVHLAGLTHDDVLLAWGGFFFPPPDHDDAGWHIVEDPNLDEALPVGQGRRASIGVESRSFGHALVEVFDADSGDPAASASTSEANRVWLRGLAPDTEYVYRITVDGQDWTKGQRRDWLVQGRETDLVPSGRSYDNRFRTFPAPDTHAPLRFAVLGDYGAGILSTDGNGERQRRLAAALERAVDTLGVRLIVTTGDNIYLGQEDTVAGTGEHDDDWYFSFYQPYRYVINRVPVYPGVGNHDADDTESSDDRAQLDDNMYISERFASGAAVGRASIDPGLFYRFTYGADVEFVAIDTTQASSLEKEQFFENPRHYAFLEDAFPSHANGSGRAGWRIPFTHHPPYCAGPSHDNMQPLIDVVVPLLERSTTRMMLSGHEHNFQHSEVNGIHYVVSGAGAKLREETPQRFEEAHTVSWAAQGHFLIIDIDGDELAIHPVTDVNEKGEMQYLTRYTPDGREVTGPIQAVR